MSEVIESVDEPGRRDQLLSCFKPDSRFVKAVAALSGDLALKDELELEKLFKPTPLDYALKKKLWTRFYEVERDGSMKLMATDIYKDVCTNGYFYEELINHPVRIAWLVTPVINTSALIEEAFHHGFKKIRHGILELPVTEKTAGVILKTWQMIADRHLGPVAQRIESKNLNVDVTGQMPGTDGAPMDLKQLEEKLTEVRAKIIGSAKDVTPE